MNILGKTVILGLSVTCLGTAGNIKTAHASTTKVTQYKDLKTAQYAVAKGSKGYLYKQATLKTKAHSIKKYSKVKFTVSKEAFVKRSNGKNAVYYYVKSSKVSGWLWHGYLNKIAVKKSSTGQNISQQKQIASLQQQIIDLKSQISSMTNASQIADLQNQISSLKDSVNTSKSAIIDKTISSTGGNSATSPDEVDKKATTDDVFNGIPIEYYIDGDSELYLYPDNQAKGYPTIINDDQPLDFEPNKVKTLQVYSKPQINKADSYTGSRGSENNMIPVEYKGQKGYVDQRIVTVVPVKELFYQLGNKPDRAGYGNVAPTEITFTNPLVDGAQWRQYIEGTQYFDDTLTWFYQASTKTWTTNYSNN